MRFFFRVLFVSYFCICFSKLLFADTPLLVDTDCSQKFPGKRFCLRIADQLFCYGDEDRTKTPYCELCDAEDPNQPGSPLLAMSELWPSGSGMSTGCPKITCWDGSFAYRYAQNTPTSQMAVRCPFLDENNLKYTNICIKRAKWLDLYLGFFSDHDNTLRYKEGYEGDSPPCAEYATKDEYKFIKFSLKLYAEMADVMKDYKQLSANFLEDNESISSIPRNLSSIENRHIKWLTTMENIFSQNQLDLNSIKDSYSYKMIVAKINSIALTFPQDSGLSATESNFSNSVIKVRNELFFIQSRFQSISSEINSFGNIDNPDLSNLKTELDKIVQNIITNFRNLEQIKFSLLDEQHVRQHVKNYIVKMWLFEAEKALHFRNVKDANDIIVQIKRSIVSLRIFAQMQTTFNHLNNVVESYFSTYYSPVMARRSIFVFQRSIEDYQNTIKSSNDIDQNYKIQMQTQIDTSKNLVASYFQRYTNMASKSSQYLDQRKKNVSLRIKLLGSQNKKLTDSCAALADKITNEPTQTSTSSSEMNYFDFRNSCWNGVSL